MILITGNPKQGLAKNLKSLYPDAFFASRENGFDLTSDQGRNKLLEIVKDYDVIINSSALWRFNQTVLLDLIYKRCKELNRNPHIICVGSTTDRSSKGSQWLYNAEKKALRDYCNSLGMMSVWGGGPKVTLISLGSLSNVQNKHPDRICMDIDVAAEYIKWIIDQPKNICVNELSIDPMQKHELSS
jgi:NADP-dependent 3-hydroxy acid dehydrogenase YdfG